MRREMLELLDKDLEFRYAVAGYLGMSEIIKRLDALEEGQRKLWEGQNKLWEEVRALREGQNKLWEEVRALREGQNKLWEEVGGLKRGHEALRRSFESFGRAIGVTFEDYTAGFLKVLLEDRGHPPEKLALERGYLGRIVDGKVEVLEVDVFNKDPLVVCEVTTHIRDLKDGVENLEKLLERARVAEEVYGRKPEVMALGVAHAGKGVAPDLEAIAKERGALLIIGRVD
ncbi:MAG: hypothetical protein QXJ15_04565 [Candidatus Bathyarchaeia archaeon]